MNPKEKAFELVEWYYCNLTEWVNWNDAKLCAIKTVDELLYDDMFDMSEELFIARITFLEEVRKEIELL